MHYMKTKDATLTIRLPSKVKDALARAAQREARSTGQMTVLLLQEVLVRRGYLPPGPDTPSDDSGGRTS